MNKRRFWNSGHGHRESSAPARAWLLVAALLAGCAAPPTALITSAKNERKVNAQSIEIDDLAADKTEQQSGVYFTGWLPISDVAVKPSFHAAFSQKLKGTLQTTSGAVGNLQISIIESGFFMDSLVSDSIVFIGLAAAFRERPYKCNAVLNVKVGGKSERREFEHIQVASRVYVDLEDKQTFINNCQDGLVEKVAAFIAAQ